MDVPSLHPRTQILFFNLIPFFGVTFLNWSAFALFYAFWLETLSIAFINSIAILFAQAHGWSFHNLTKSITFLLVQIGILFFYLIFIIVFLGLQIDYGDGQYSFISYLILIEPSFRWSVLTLFGLKLVEFIYLYFFKNLFRTSHPSDFYYVFTSRTIVIHIVIVLGFFSYTFLKTYINSYAGVLAFTGIFVITKIIFELLLLNAHKGKV